MKGNAAYAQANGEEFTKIPQLPAGGYILKIMDAKEEAFEWGTKVTIAFDIEDGEHKGHFAKVFESNKNSTFENKWKGTHQIRFSDDTSNMDKYQKSWNFAKQQIEAINKSNPYSKAIDPTKDWDPATELKGKYVGALFGEKEYDFNGKQGWFTTCVRFTTVDKIKKGEFTIPAKQSLQKETPKADTSSVLSDFEESAVGEVPF